MAVLGCASMKHNQPEGAEGFAGLSGWKRERALANPRVEVAVGVAVGANQSTRLPLLRASESARRRR